MAERKRRPPSSKVKPGTPHPTKAYTVRGYDGRWISTKAFNAAKRAKEKATAKGGALVKRTTSAVTKAANKASDLLKINKGDKGIVRAVKDTFKLGKDTRKSYETVKNAGKVTRQVHDKLVKGGKDFLSGVREAGKDTKRAVNQLKPGGKLVAQAKKFNGVNYNAIPKNLRGALVKVSKDGGKGKTFKFDYKKIPKSFEKKPTPKVPTSATAKTTAGRVKNKTTYQAKRTASQARKFARNTATKARETAATTRFGTGKPFPEATKAAKTSKSLKISKYLKNLKPSTIAGGVVKGGIGAGVEIGLESGLKHLVNRGFRQLEGKQKMSMKEYKALLDKRNAERKSKTKFGLFVKKKGTDTKKTETKSKDKKTYNSRGRVTKTETTKTTESKPKMKTWDAANAYKGPKQPKITFNNNTKKKTGDDLKVTQANTKVENKKVVKTGGQGNQQKNQTKDTRGKQAGAYAAGYLDAKPTKKKRMHSIEKENRKIHGDKAIDILKQKHKEWKLARKNGTLDAWRKKWKKK